MVTAYAVAVIVGLSALTVLGDILIKLAADGPQYVDMRYFTLGFIV